MTVVLIKGRNLETDMHKPGEGRGAQGPWTRSSLSASEGSNPADT